MSASALRYYIAELLNNSANCHAVLEKLNIETGEYRLVLQGIREPDLAASGPPPGVHKI